MGLFDRFKKKQNMNPSDEKFNYYLTLQINARLQPINRGDIYEDPIGEVLGALGCGTTTGGGTMMQENGEIAFCNVDIALNEKSNENMDKLLRTINDANVPKGSFLKTENLEMPVGTIEGLALYLNGTELPDEVYATCDINHAVAKINELLAQSGSMYDHWQGPEETALYFYGRSFDEMKEKMETFLREYPLCQKCRIKKIA